MVHNKYIIRLSFLGLFLNIVANIMLYRYFMIEEIMLKQVATENARIASIYQREIWSIHKNAVNKLKNNDYKTLLQDQEFINFVKDSIHFFSYIGAKISLFDMYGNLVITNIETQSVGSNYQESFVTKLLNKIDSYFLNYLNPNITIDSAYKGKTAYSLWSQNVKNGEDIIKAYYITSYIPIIDVNLKDFVIDSALQINTEITPEWNNMVYLEYRGLIAFFVIFLVFFIIVTYNTNYARRIITKQFEANKELEEARIRAETESSAKTEFLANISHELRTPLNAIIGFSEIIITETYGTIENKQYKEYVQDINNSGKHLLTIINDILDLSKASVDKLKVDNIELDLNKLASASMRFVKPRAEEAKVVLIEDMPKEHVVITADPKRLKQALLNLLSNAVKFTPENGKITLKISTNSEQKEVYIQVIDTGIGMSEKDIPKALSTFGQIDNKLSRKYEGTGLGLPLTRKLIKLMQGGFEIKSTLGVGTTITLTFKYV